MTPVANEYHSECKRRTILQRSRETELTKVGLYCVRELRKRALGQSDELRGLKAGARKVHLLVSGEKSVFQVRQPPDARRSRTWSLPRGENL